MVLSQDCNRTQIFRCYSCVSSRGAITLVLQPPFEISKGNRRVGHNVVPATATDAIILAGNPRTVSRLTLTDILWRKQHRPMSALVFSFKRNKQNPKPGYLILHANLLSCIC